MGSITRQMRRMGLEYLCIDEWIEFMVNVGKYCIWASDMNKVAIPMTDPWDVCIFTDPWMMILMVEYIDRKVCESHRSVLEKNNKLRPFFFGRVSRFPMFKNLSQHMMYSQLHSQKVRNKNYWDTTLYALDIQTPAEVRYLDPPNICLKRIEPQKRYPGYLGMELEFQSLMWPRGWHSPPKFRLKNGDRNIKNLGYGCFQK